MEKLSLKEQQELKNYLIKFYECIYTIRLRIQIHKEIAEVASAGNLLREQFWAYLQNNVLVSLIVAGMFSIFNDNNKYILKKFIRFLRKQTIYSLSEQDVENWIGQLEPYKNFRNEIIAHAGLKTPFVPEIYYLKFLEILEQFEHKLREIHNKHITDYSLINSVWPASEVNFSEVIILSELRQLLDA